MTTLSLTFILYAVLLEAESQFHRYSPRVNRKIPALIAIQTLLTLRGFEKGFAYTWISHQIVLTYLEDK